VRAVLTFHGIDASGALPSFPPQLASLDHLDAALLAAFGVARLRVS